MKIWPLPAGIHPHFSAKFLQKMLDEHSKSLHEAVIESSNEFVPPIILEDNPDEKEPPR